MPVEPIDAHEFCHTRGEWSTVAEHCREIDTDWGCRYDGGTRFCDIL